MGPKQLSLGILFLSFFHFYVNGQYTAEDWEDRDRWMDVPELMRLAGIKDGDRVADVGCHEGYFTFHLSKQVGEDGQVYAVDVSEYRLDNLKEHLKERKTTNVKVILGDYDNPKLPKETLDVVMVMDTYHEMEEYMEILDHIKKALKPGGRLLILEKLKEHKKGKGRDEQADAHTLASKYVKRELVEAGFSVSREVSDFGIWNHESEKRMWVVVAKK